MVLEFFWSFSIRSYPPVRKCANHCGMNMSTNIAFKTRTRCYSFDRNVRKCNDSLVVNILATNSEYFRTGLYLLCYCCCVRYPAYRNSKSSVYPLWCQDSGPPTRSYTAAAAGVADQCCCYNSCCGLGPRTHELCLWVEGIHTTSRDTPSRLRSNQALTSTVSQQ